jgi:flagellar biosynthesis/type III secretory pathway M-ring protein FliF/YscJ
MPPAHGHPSLRDTIAQWLTLPHRQHRDSRHIDNMQISTNSTAGGDPPFMLVPQMHCPSMTCALVLLFIPVLYAILAFVSWKKMRSRRTAAAALTQQQFEEMQPPQPPAPSPLAERQQPDPEQRIDVA